MGWNLGVLPPTVTASLLSPSYPHTPNSQGCKRLGSPEVPPPRATNQGSQIPSPRGCRKAPGHRVSESEGGSPMDVRGLKYPRMKEEKRG